LLTSLALAVSTHASGTAEDSGHAHEVMAPGASLPGESVYQLTVPLTDQDGKDTSLDALQGRPVILAMFYTSCDGVCPMLAFAMRRVLTALPQAHRGRLQAVMVSFDSQRDAPVALRAFAQLHDLTQPQWLVARASESDVRELAAVLGVRYRELPGGIYSHSAVITLLDAQGVIRARTTTLNALDPDFMQAVDRVLE
jgi:protein SCO1/2